MPVQPRQDRKHGVFATDALSDGCSAHSPKGCCHQLLRISALLCLDGKWQTRFRDEFSQFTTPALKIRGFTLHTRLLSAIHFAGGAQICFAPCS
jgi:hypothetical protein